jgi:hypothetical protein
MLKYCALSFLVCTSLHAGRPGEGSDSEEADKKAPLARTSSGSSSSSGSDLDDNWPSLPTYRNLTIEDVMVNPKLMEEFLQRGGCHPVSIPHGVYLQANGDARQVHRNVFKLFTLMPEPLRTLGNAKQLLGLLQQGPHSYQSRMIAISDEFVSLFGSLSDEDRTLDSISVVQKFLTRKGVNADIVNGLEKMSPADRLGFMQGMNRLIGQAVVDQASSEKPLDFPKERSQGDMTDHHN